MESQGCCHQNALITWASVKIGLWIILAKSVEHESKQIFSPVFKCGSGSPQHPWNSFRGYTKSKLIIILFVLFTLIPSQVCGRVSQRLMYDVYFVKFSLILLFFIKIFLYTLTFIELSIKDIKHFSLICNTVNISGYNSHKQKLFEVHNNF